MNKRQVNQANMLEITLTYLDANSAVWQAVPKILSVKNTLSELYSSVLAAAGAQEAAQSTMGQSKMALKLSIAMDADVINDLVEVFATVEGNAELARKMSDSKTDLYRLSYSDFILRVNTIVEHATANKEALIADYGMTDEQLTKLQTNLNNLVAMSDEPRALQVQKSVATQDMEDLFAQITDLLHNQLDKLMSIFKNRNASFYIGYLKARVIVDY